MLTLVDRVQIVVADGERTAASFERLLGAARLCEDRLALLSARRLVLQLGQSEVELLQPDGSGRAAEFLARTKGGLIAPGFAAQDLLALRAHLKARGVEATQEGGQLFVPLDSIHLPGLYVVVSPYIERRPVGAVTSLYEATLLVNDFAPTVRDVAASFALDAQQFVPIRSEEFGYEGTLTLFHPDRLHRMEIITPTDATKTMGRFLTRRSGPCWYMCFAEADDLLPIRARLMEQAPGQWTGPRGATVDSLFIHPPALGGMMLGLSRASFAWIWSGHPERVEPAHAPEGAA